jgi:hypothetical protein
MNLKTNLQARGGLAFMLLCCATSPLLAQRGAITVSRNLADLTHQASVIVRGHVISARAEQDPNLNNLWTVVVSVHVEEVLKGSAGSTLTFRQFIWDSRDRDDAAGYRKGQYFLLMLNPPTKYGLTSPAGLEQGRFQILRSANGEEIAANGHGNAGLFRNLRAALQRDGVSLPPRLAAFIATSPVGPIRLDDLRELIRAMAKTSTSK